MVLCAWRRWADDAAQCPAIDIRIVMYGAYRDLGVEA
ncbi:hypothetical protein J2X24_001318 [Asticcacaulis solisilvae]|nr:hypothetical protein [Asticcacaulis solisilvae]MDR6799801.1 hypothetical protein [Asticcacaulis sp. BE141]